MLAHRHGDMNLMFMLTTLRRQIASCVFGLAPLLEAMLHRHLSQIEISEIADEVAPDEIADTLNEFGGDVSAIIRKADALAGPDPSSTLCSKSSATSRSCPTTNCWCSPPSATRWPTVSAQPVHLYL
jgi:hypothetical protein